MTDPSALALAIIVWKSDTPIDCCQLCLFKAERRRTQTTPLCTEIALNRCFAAPYTLCSWMTPSTSAYAAAAI